MNSLRSNVVCADFYPYYGPAGFQIGFPKQSVLERLSLCRRFIQGVAKAPVAKRQYVRLAECQNQLAETEAAVSLVDALRIRLREAVTARNASLDQLCRGVTRSALGYLGTAENTSDIVAVGLVLPKPKVPNEIGW